MSSMFQQVYPLVSIVVPTYKLAHLLPHTLISIQQQTFKDFEVVICDDGSPDDVRGAAAPFISADTRFRYVRQENGGLPAARNFGYSVCSSSSTYVMFLDADDCLHPDALMILVGALDKIPDAGMVHCLPRFVDYSGTPIQSKNPWGRGWSYGPRQLTNDDSYTPLEAIYTLTAGIICSLSLLRRTIYDATGGFDETFGHHREDTNVFIGIALRSSVLFVPKALVDYRRHPGQMSEDSAGLDSQASRLHRKWTEDKSIPKDYQRRINECEVFRKSPSLKFAIAMSGAAHQWSLGKPILAARIAIGAVKLRLIKGTL